MKVFWKVMLRVLNKYKGWWLNSGGEMGGRKPTNMASKLKYAYMFKMQSFPNCIKMWPFFVKSDIFFFVSPKYSDSWSGIIWCLCRSSPPALTDWAEGHSTLLLPGTDEGDVLVVQWDGRQARPHIKNTHSKTSQFINKFQFFECWSCFPQTASNKTQIILGGRGCVKYYYKS